MENKIIYSPKFSKIKLELNKKKRELCVLYICAILGVEIYKLIYVYNRGKSCDKIFSAETNFYLRKKFFFNLIEC